MTPRNRLAHRTGWWLAREQPDSGITLVAWTPPSPADGRTRWFVDKDAVDNFLYEQARTNDPQSVCSGCHDLVAAGFEQQHAECNPVSETG